MLTIQNDDDSSYVFVAKLDNARNISTILKAIHFKEVSLYVIWYLLKYVSVQFDKDTASKDSTSDWMTVGT